MCQKLTGSETGLLGYFRMDEKTGAITENKAIGSTLDGTIVPAPTWGYSGAPIGDVSKSEYNFGATNLTFTNNGLTIGDFTLAANQGIQVYKVNEAPSQTVLGTGLDSLHLNSYFGVFPVGIAGYKVTFDYSSTNINGKTREDSLTFASRADNSRATWNKIANTTLNTIANLVGTPLLSGQNEIIGAFAPPPIPGAALDFDGVDDMISVLDDNSLDLVNNFTLSAWVKTQDLSKKQRVFHKSGLRGYAFGMEAGGKLMFTSYGVADVFTPMPVVLVNTWTHIAVTYNNNVINFYTNGNLVHTQIVAMIFLANTSNFIIGSETGASFWNGQLDEVRLWSRALCEAEIKNSMYCDNLTFKTELVAQYSFNQGVAGGNNAGIITAIDSSGNNNNGTLSSTFALSGLTSNWVDGSPVKSDSICKPIVLPLGTNWTWTGAVSKDWFSPCNWDMLSVPNASSSVIIPKVTNQPEIKGNLNIARCKNLEIKTSLGAKLELFTNTGAKLEVKP